MAIQGSSKGKFYCLPLLVLSTFALFLSGCTTGDGSGRNSNAPAGFLTVEADAGKIINLVIDDTLPNPPPVYATLDGSDSTPQGSVTYAWSFTHKPDLSNAVLLNPTSASPSFIADVKGSYMIQLVVTANGVSSARDIALVEAMNPGERPPFIHIDLASRCSNCHFEGSLNRTKSGDHIATTNLCQACHTTYGFELARFTDHLEVFGNCSSCHNGITAVGKSRWHVETVLECDDCHNTNSFLELEPDGSYNHDRISRPCEGCHNNVIAVGKHEGHIGTNEACNRCHSTTAFAPAIFNHDAVDYSITSCVSCHDGAGPGLSSIGKTATHPVTSDNCQICHNTIDFNLNGNFNHDVIDDENILCIACHDGNHVAAGARGVTNTVVHNNALSSNTDCGNCHNTDNFANDFVDHTSDAVTLNRCDSCHNGTDAIGVPSPAHVPLNNNEDCNLCHTPGNFATGFFDHTAVEADLGTRCDSCHNEVITVGKFSNHVPTTEDCRVCHSTTTFNGATVDHTGIVSGCATCHNGVYATGKEDSISAHIPTTDDCSVCHVYGPAFTPSTFLTGAHTTITSNCQSCHGLYATPKPRATHIPTVDDCSNCHVTSSFLGATFDHTGVDRGCEGCHNGRFTTASNTILGKPTGTNAHIPTSQDCYFCHNFATGWLASGQTDFAHIGISGNCTSCHNGNYVTMGALAKTPSPPHPVTNADCGACHTTSDVPPTFTNFFVDHSGITNNCGSSGCHDATTTEGIYARSASHGPTNGNDCELCHTAGAAWLPAVFDHSNVSRTTRCDSCHNGTNATGKAAKVNPPHIPTTEDCRACHNTTSFAGATFDHQGITGNCGSCHNGTTATGKPNNHVPTNDDCVNCHQTTGFLPATFDHTGITGNCQSCHDGVFATGKIDAPTPHIQTTQDCGVCHNTTGFIPATFDHTGITNNCARSGCHGSGATGKPATHVPTTLDCSNCHTTATFVGGTWVHDASTAGRCLDCHVTGGGATPQPTTNHFVTGPGVQCDSCHTTTTWADQGTFDHCPNTNANNNRCGNYPGDHRVGRTTCRSCHTTNRADFISYPDQAQYAPFCAGCHAGDFRRQGDHIGGSNGTVLQNRDCGQSGCHRVNASGF